MSVKAYRVFRAYGEEQDDPKLKSVYFDVSWPKDDPMIEAECRERHVMWWGVKISAMTEEEREAQRHDEIAPHGECSEGRSTVYGCGIYTATNEEEARKWGKRTTATSFATPVLAEVEIWGKTVPHEFGYRSQFCRVTGIIPIEDEPSDLEEVISEEYGVPLLEREKEDG